MPQDPGDKHGAAFKKSSPAGVLKIKNVDFLRKPTLRNHTEARRLRRSSANQNGASSMPLASDGNGEPMSS